MSVLFECSAEAWYARDGMALPILRISFLRFIIAGSVLLYWVAKAAELLATTLYLNVLKLY